MLPRDDRSTATPRNFLLRPYKDLHILASEAFWQKRYLATRSTSAILLQDNPDYTNEHLKMNSAVTARPEIDANSGERSDEKASGAMKHGLDVYFSADVETDGPIPGPFSILSFALVFAGTFDGVQFTPPPNYEQSFYRELRPISDDFQIEALRVNGLDRERLLIEGEPPDTAMNEAEQWIRGIVGDGKPILVAYPLSFDWSWLYWYFTKFSKRGSPFNHSLCFDIKTAFAVKAGIPISEAGKSKLLPSLRPQTRHTHHALEDAIEQAEIFANVFTWEGAHGRTP